MLSKNTRKVSKVLNPFLGFGWSTSTGVLKNNRLYENKSNEKVLKVEIEQ